MSNTINSRGQISQCLLEVNFYSKLMGTEGIALLLLHLNRFFIIQNWILYINQQTLYKLESKLLKNQKLLHTYIQ